MNKTKIEWCDYTWNPVVGCKHGCKYCYAKSINTRFKLIPVWTKPEFYPERLDKPSGKYPPTKYIPFRTYNKSLIFVVSMGDLFGDWVAEFWIQAVIETIKTNPQHEFMLLTKNPKRYKQFWFPENAWLGATIEDSGFQSMMKLNDLVSESDNQNRSIRKFISLEPIMDSFHGVKFLVDLVIVGAMTGPGAIITEPSWIESVEHHNIFLKDSAKKVMKQQITTKDLQDIDHAKEL